MFTFVSIAIITSGGFSVLIGLAFFVGTIRFLRAAVRTTGVVVAHETRISEDREGKTVYVHPVVEFEDGAGQEHRVTLATGTSGFQPFPAGKQVEILFPPDNPAKARIRHFVHLWAFPTAFTVLGCAGVGFGLLFHAWTSTIP